MNYSVPRLPTTTFADMLSDSVCPRVKGPFRDGTIACATGNHVIAAFLEMVFGHPQNGMN